MSGTHDHGHEHANGHDPHAPIIDNGVNPYAQRVNAMVELLIEKGVISRAEIEAQKRDLESRTPADGARIVARAWADPAFKQRLLNDFTLACAEVGLDTSGYAVIKAVENTDQVHHLVVCTLCSCYPRMLLGLPPDWYKSLSYRSRAVIEPRAVMAEFGLHLPPDIEVRVLDSTADLRYLVIPRRPAGTDGMSEADLAELVTRDSMIGVTEARQPALAPSAP